MIQRFFTLGALVLATASHAFVLQTGGTTEFRHWRLFSPTPGVSSNVINLTTSAITSRVMPIPQQTRLPS